MDRGEGDQEGHRADRRLKQRSYSVLSSRRRASSVSGTDQWIGEKAIKKAIEPTDCTATGCAVVAAASSLLGIGVKTCSTTANSRTIRSGCNRETGCDTTRSSLNSVRSEDRYSDTGSQDSHAHTETKGKLAQGSATTFKDTLPSSATSTTR